MFDDLPYLFNPESIKKIPPDLIDGVRYIYSIYMNELHKNTNKDVKTQMLYYQAYLVLFKFIQSNGGDPGEIIDPDSGEKIVNNIRVYFQQKYNQYHQLYISREKAKMAEQLERDINSQFGSDFYYEFQEEDIEKIQELSSKIRQILNDSDDFSEDHKKRLLRLLGKFDSELYRKMTGFGNFLSFMFELNILYRNAKEAEPVFALLIEISKVIANAVKMSMGLPPDTDIPMLK